jgi:hypothetical protein
VLTPHHRSNSPQFPQPALKLPEMKGKSCSIRYKAIWNAEKGNRVTFMLNRDAEHLMAAACNGH